MPNKMVDVLLSPCVWLCGWLENLDVGFERAAAIAAGMFITGLAVVAALIVCVAIDATVVFWVLAAALVLIVLVGYFYHRLIEYMRAF